MSGREVFGGLAALRRRQAAVGATILAPLALLVPLVWTARALPVEVPFLEGTAWLSSPDEGQIAQINGQTGQVDGVVDVGDVTDVDGVEQVSVTQTDEAVVVEIDGTLYSIDLTSVDWSGDSTEAGTAQVVAGTTAEGAALLFLVGDEGTVERLDPLSLETLGRASLPGAPRRAVVAEGRLVVATSGEGRALVQVVDITEGEGEITRTAVVGQANDQIELTRVGTDVAITNLTDKTLRRLDPVDPTEPVAVDADLPPGEAAHLPEELPEGDLWLSDSQEGRILAVDLTTGALAADLELTSDGNDLTSPTVLGSRVFVVDRDAGMVIQVDAEEHIELTPRERLEDHGIDDASRVELFTEDGKAFVNDLGGPTSIVYSEDGTALTVDKYDESDNETGPDDGEPDETEQGDDAGNEPDGEGAPDDGSPPEQGDESPPDEEPVPGTTAPPGTAPPTTAPPGTTPPTTAPPATTPPTTAPEPATPPTTAPEPEPPDNCQTLPPGAVDPTATPSNGQVTLSWDAASAPCPDEVTYTIASDTAIGGATSWTTRQESHTISGMTNGQTYRLTITPSNRAGHGPSSSLSVTPAGAPGLTDVSAESVGERDIEVSFSWDANGGIVESCAVTHDGDPVSTTCHDESGTATVTVPYYATFHTFDVVVTTNVTSTTETVTARAEAKSLTVDGSAGRWSGSCYFDEHGTDRPVVGSPSQACRQGGEGSGYYTRLASDGSTEDVVCREEDVEIQDNQEETSTTWLRLEDGDWMSELYFDDWEDAADGLLTCDEWDEQNRSRLQVTPPADNARTPAGD